ncbi:hypothetical protein BDR07DRAFT_1309187, partial [Suillus spraguei]
MTSTGREEYDRVPVHDEAHRTSSPRRKSPISCFSCLRPRRVFALLKFALPLVFVICYMVYYLYDPRGHIDLVLYQREWIQREILPLSPLGGCFEPERVSPLYNVSEAVYGKKRFEVQAGVTMRMG